MNFKGVAFVSGAFRGENMWQVFQNTVKAMEAIPKLISLGYAPLVPHRIYGMEMQGLFPDETYLGCCCEIIRRLRPETDVLFMLEGWERSEGAVEEYNLARELGITIMGEGDYE